MTYSSNVFAEIKSRLTIFDVARFCGIDLPENKKFCSPLRPDTTPSCSATNDLFTDWTSREYLDVPAFFAALRGISLAEARRELVDRLGIAEKTSLAAFGKLPQKIGEVCGSTYAPATKATPQPAHVTTEPLPALYANRDFFRELADLRCVSVEAVSLAVDNFGTIKFFHNNGWGRGWVLTDSSERIIQGRLLSGSMWFHGGKTHNFKKGIHYPVGIATKWAFPADFPILLVEGSGDYLAACDIDLHAEREFLPVAMMGTAARIPDDCLPFFRGREINIIAHPAERGCEAAQAWKSQLDPVAKVKGTHLRDCDLNDLVKRDGAAAVAKGLDL